MKAQATTTALLLVGATIAGCGEGTLPSDDVASKTSALVYSVKTFYDSISLYDRTIYAVNNFQGTPRVRITTKNIFTGTCYSYEKGLAPRTKVDSKVCSAVGLIYEFITWDLSYCATVTPSPVKVDSFSYEFASPYESQLNYEVVDVGPDPGTGAPTIFGRSTWVGGNGCPRNFSPL